MSNKFACLLSLLLVLSIIFLPSQFLKESKEPLKVDPESNIRKRISKTILNKAKSKKSKNTFRQVSNIPKKEDPVNMVMASSLQKEINEYINKGIKDIRIVLNTTDDTDELSSRVESYGGQVIRKRTNLMAIEIPVDKAGQLIQESSSVEYARLPFKFYPSEEITEGVELTGANLFHDTIYKGAGVKVAVLDVGFKGLTEAISAGELPGNVITHDFSKSGLETEYYHGTACAEIVHDMAPDAELYLLKMGDEIAGYEVIDYCIENNIDIVSLSVGTFGSGPGDGTGPLDEAFDQLRDAGILVIASAGNYGNTTYEELTFGSHWEGTFTDNDDLGDHEFKENDVNSYYNVIGAYPSWNDDDEPSRSEVSILMRWNDWEVSDIDYDMYLYEFDYENQEVGDLVASSEDWQTGSAYDFPMEYISLNVPDSATEGRFYALFISRYDEDTPTGIELEIYLGGTSEFVPFINFDGTYNRHAFATSASSITEPADAESVLTVGAIDYINWTTGPQEEYSSQGPTNAWNGSVERIKPDIMGPDRVTTYTYGTSSFYGTSAAAPHVAGIAALTLSVNSNMTPDELQEFLEVNATDMGYSGKDNLYGRGRINSRFSYPIVKSYQKISETEGNFTGTFDNGDYFGWSIASIGDFDNDGVTDLAVGTPEDDDGGYGKGAIWILFMNKDGSVKSHQKISDTEGNFTGAIDLGDYFGSSIAKIGDINGDSISDLAVGAPYTDGGGYNRGAVWILFMNSNATVKSYQKISDTEGGFTGALDNEDYFGSSVTGIGDLNGDGIVDISVGAMKDDDGFSNSGALWVLFMNSNGTVKSYQKISNTEGGAGPIDYGDYFGNSITSIGDLNKDGITDLAAGARYSDDGGSNKGAVWVLFMNTDGTVKLSQKISNTNGGFTGTLADGDLFGYSVASVGDLSGDEVVDLAVGVYGDDGGGGNSGAVWVLFMNTDGTVKLSQKISNTIGGFTGTLDNEDYFGSSIASMGDINDDGTVDLAVGAYGDDDGGSSRGAVWILFLDSFPSDIDHDRMLDSWEIQYGLNPDIDDASGDYDNDGLTNLIEYRAGTYPNEADSDNDGIIDGNEDVNHNGIIDSGETDPTDPDTDNDGMPDGWEVQYGLDPLVDDAEEDLDGDGFNNIKEYEKETLPNDPESRPKTGMPWLQLLLGD